MCEKYNYQKGGDGLNGVILTPLRQIYNPKGDIFHAMKKSDDGFVGFGEAYFSTINQGDIKGWKKHTKMTLNIVVIVGEIKFVVYDENTKEFFCVKLSHENYQRLTVGPGLWMGFKGIGKNNTLLNLSNIEHSPSETISVNLGRMQYEW